MKGKYINQTMVEPYNRNPSKLLAILSQHMPTRTPIKLINTTLSQKRIVYQNPCKDFHLYCVLLFGFLSKESSPQYLVEDTNQSVT